MGSAPHQMSGITAHRLNTTSQTLRRSWNSNERVRTTLFYRTGYAVCPNAPNASTGGRTLTVLGGRRTQLSYPCATTIREGRLAARCRYPLVGLRRPSRREEERVSPPETKKSGGEGWFPLRRTRLVSISWRPSIRMDIRHLGSWPARSWYRPPGTDEGSEQPQ